MGAGVPQPLLRLLRPGKSISVEPRLPLHEPELCAHAMNAIALWALVEREVSVMTSGFVKGKRAQIAAQLMGSNSDAQKTAIRNALAESLAPDERLIFDAIMAEHESCYKLRNPLAHWTLGHSRRLPNVIIAIDPRAYVKINSEEEALLNKLIRQGGDPKVRGKKFVDRLSKKTISDLGDIYRKHLGAMSAYRMPDLDFIEKKIDNLRTTISRFHIANRLRLLKVDPTRRRSLLNELAQGLGLPPPTAT